MCCAPSECCILVIDDNDAVRVVIEVCLRRMGFNVISAHGREEVTRLIATKRFDLVVTDLMMPDMNGAEVLAEIKKHQPPAAVLTLSGAPEDETAREVGLRAMLGKPFSVEELNAAVAAVLPRCVLA